MKKIVTSTLVIAVNLLTACSTIPQEDAYIFGEATRHNREAQAVRDLNLPNSNKVESISGVRAAKAVKALNDGTTRELKQANASQAGGS